MNIATTRHWCILASVVLPEARRVLILGGGDGLAAREVLRYPRIRVHNAWSILTLR